VVHRPAQRNRTGAADPPVRGLQADDTAQRGRRAYPPSGVRPERCRGIPAATAAPGPPLEPPELRAKSHGLRVRAVETPNPGSWVWLLPMITPPASGSRRTAAVSQTARGALSHACEPHRVTRPATSKMSLIAMGLPLEDQSGAGGSRVCQGLTLLPCVVGVHRGERLHRRLHGISLRRQPSSRSCGSVVGWRGEGFACASQ
jgi:hypothetical protein